ncbi:PQQ-binding-like beta-propeller repeat protein [Streptomyces cinnabarinus]|uniref:PQQ-binding-like beta-propeller repeat protein n=1 Tax=Streptomyces cinnabarinus TaxID=67287 RepID=A0ABY7KNX1_9ACTN|nr:PQQ-binding-like beta-propeller repeat protein [Streptomyces cinnabarinus]WAZ24757.1 PQQ-binding-like beta-propeller repeat protein [Streptomyces cinnabarinus]
MRLSTRGGRFVVPVGLVLGLLTACGSGSGGEGGAPAPQGSGRSTTAAAKGYNPPLKFQDQPAHDIAGGVDEGNWSVELRETTAYAVSDEEVRAVSVLDGEELWSVRPRGQLAEDTDYGTDAIAGPHFVAIDGRIALLAAFSVTEPGSGTTPDRPLIELTAVAADSGKRLWTATVERPEGHEEGEPYLAGADATTAVLTFGGETDAVSVGISLATRETTWTEQGFDARFVDTGVVVGRGGADSALGGGATVEGRKTADGSKAWTYRDRLNKTELSPVGGGLFTAVVDAPFESETRIADLLAISTGKPPAGLRTGRALGEPDDLSCWWAEGSAVVCETEKDFDERVVALDPENWGELWFISSDDKTRLMPDVSTVFRSAVYGETENGSVVLDARTGKDRASGDGDAPFAVDEYAGLFGTSLGTIESRRAVS